jgi:hypothetical protein
MTEHLEASLPWSVPEGPNERLWGWLGEELPPVKLKRGSGLVPGDAVEAVSRPRDPYMEQGCHPDIVARIWDQLGRTLPRSCRAQAKGKPVLAEPTSRRIFAVGRGTSYALWLTPEDFAKATDDGASTKMVWSGGEVTYLACVAGNGWIWGKWYADEALWLRHSYDALGQRVTL